MQPARTRVPRATVQALVASGVLDARTLRERTGASNRNIYRVLRAHSNFIEDVRAAIADVPTRQVVTYKWIAEKAGYPQAQRAVGVVLNRHCEDLAWWRVIHWDGTMSARDRELDQESRLAEEGVELRNGRTVERPLHPR